MEKRLEVFDSDSSDNYGVNAIDDVTKEPKLAEESKDYSLKKCLKIWLFKVLPTDKKKNTAAIR